VSARACPAPSPDARGCHPDIRSLHVRCASPSRAALAPIARLSGHGQTLATATAFADALNIGVDKSRMANERVTDQKYPRAGEGIGVRIASVADLRQRANSCRPRAGCGT
jgi:hypothetical protein